MVVSSIRIHRNKPSKVIEEIVDIANALETQMKVSLIDGGYFRLIYTSDHKWCYIVLHAAKKMAFESLKSETLELSDISNYGEIIAMGEGIDVPDEKRTRMHQEWYSHYETYCDNELTI